jgi:hypothetical protein
MRQSEYLREKAEKCRALAKLTADPDAIRQLLTWAVELDEEADKAEARERR